MGILTEQNILGNPTLGSAVRPGSSQLISDYSFAVAREASEPAAIVNPKFTAPSPYGIDPLFGTVTKTAPPVTEGINGDPIVFPQAPGHYGPGPYNPMPDSQQTNLGGAAEVIAGNTEPVESPVTKSAMTQMESYYNREFAGPEIQASGAPVLGFDTDNQYYINKSQSAAPAAESKPVPPASLGDAPEPPAEATPAAKSVDAGAQYAAMMMGGGYITPKAITAHPWANMYPQAPTPPKTQSSSTDSFNQMEAMMQLMSSGKGSKPGKQKTSGASAKKSSAGADRMAAAMARRGS